MCIKISISTKEERINFLFCCTDCEEIHSHRDGGEMWNYSKWSMVITEYFFCILGWF